MNHRTVGSFCLYFVIHPWCSVVCASNDSRPSGLVFCNWRGCWVVHCNVQCVVVCLVLANLAAAAAVVADRLTHLADKRSCLTNFCSH